MDKHPKYISEEEQELFERFLMGEMPVAEKLSFKAQLADNETLQKSFDEFKALFETVEEAGLRNQLGNFHKQMEISEETSVQQLNPKKRFNYRIAASVAILIALGGFWFFNQPNSNERLFNEYYRPDPGLPTVMGSNDNYAFYEAMVDYKQGNYGIAIEKWKKLLVAKPENDTLNYFLGVAHLSNEQAPKSLFYLENVTNDKNSKFNEESRYYLALSYLKIDKKEDAKKLLVQLKSTKAQKLLKALNKS